MYNQAWALELPSVIDCQNRSAASLYRFCLYASSPLWYCDSPAAIPLLGNAKVSVRRRLRVAGNSFRTSLGQLSIWGILALF